MITLFALNRHLQESMPLEVALPGFGTSTLIEALVLRHDDLTATNTREHPERVSPQRLKGVKLAADHVRPTLAPAWWNMIRLALASWNMIRLGPVR